ncbi:6050_t:CDS:1, partial [Rhizophagus irregularis]
MGKQPHPFHLYFELVSNLNNKTNKYAVCLCCIEEYTRNIAITKKECCIFNKAKYYHDHLASYENFKE